MKRLFSERLAMVEEGMADRLGGTIDADLDRVLQATGGVVDQVDSTHFTRPNACSAWSLRELLNHIVAVSEKVSSFASERPDHPRAGPGDRLRADWRAGYWETADEVMRPLRQSRVCLGRTCYLACATFPR